MVQLFNSRVIDLKMNWSVLDKKRFFYMVALSSTSRLDRRSFIFTIGKNVFKNIDGLICSVKSCSPEVVLYLR